MIDLALLSQSIVGQDYIKYLSTGKKQPPIDAFLDYINRVKEAKEQHTYTDCIYDLEIEATKHILSLETECK